MRNNAVTITLVTSTVIAFANILLTYYLTGHNPANRLGYATFISVTPALAAFLWIRFRRVAWAWPQIAATYIVLYTAVSIIQGYARMIPLR